MMIMCFLGCLLLLCLALNGVVVEGAKGRVVKHNRRGQSNNRKNNWRDVTVGRRRLLIKDDDDDDDEPIGGKAKKLPTLEPAKKYPNIPGTTGGNNPVPTPSAPSATPKPVYILTWGTSWDDTQPVSPSSNSGSATNGRPDEAGQPTTTNNNVAVPPQQATPVLQPTASPTPDMTMERICQAAWEGRPYPSSNHVHVSYNYQVQAKGSLTASAVPDAVGRLLTEGYILRHCQKLKRRRNLLSDPGDVQSVASYRAVLLLNETCTSTTTTGQNSCQGFTRWEGTNRVYFRDDYTITPEIEAMILADITYAFESGNVMDELKRSSDDKSTIQAVEFVTGSGSTTAIVEDDTIVTAAGGTADDSPDTLDSIGIEATSKRGLKPVGMAFLSIAVVSVVAVSLVAGFISLKKKKRSNESKSFKSLSDMHLGTANTMQYDEEFDTNDVSDGFIQFRPGKVHVTEPSDTHSYAGYGAEMMLDDQSMQSSHYTNPLRRHVSVDDPRDTQSMAGHGAEMKLRDTSLSSSNKQHHRATAGRFTPDTLPRSNEVIPRRNEVVPPVHHLDDDDTLPSFQNIRSAISSPRNYRVPDTLDL